MLAILHLFSSYLLLGGRMNGQKTYYFLLFFQLDLPAIYALEYQFIKGIREGSSLLHVMPEDMLYVFIARRKNSKVLICYQSILASEKKNTDIDHVNWSSVKLHRDGPIERMKIAHTNHENHVVVRRDMNERNNMKTSCRNLKQHFPEDSHKIGTRHVFQREILK